VGPTSLLCLQVPQIIKLITLEPRVMIAAVVQSNMFGLKQQAHLDKFQNEFTFCHPTRGLIILLKWCRLTDQQQVSRQTGRSQPSGQAQPKSARQPA
jgi:hypothetical protein